MLLARVFQDSARHTKIHIFILELDKARRTHSLVDPLFLVQSGEEKRERCC